MIGHRQLTLLFNGEEDYEILPKGIHVAVMRAWVKRFGQCLSREELSHYADLLVGKEDAARVQSARRYAELYPHNITLHRAVELTDRVGQPDWVVWVRKKKLYKMYQDDQG